MDSMLSYLDLEVNISDRKFTTAALTNEMVLVFTQSTSLTWTATYLHVANQPTGFISLNWME